MRYLFAAAAALAFSTPTTAATIVEADAGSACAVTTIGLTTCIWTDADGKASSANVTTSLLAGHNKLRAGIAITQAALSGLVTVNLSYPLTSWDYNWAEQLRKGVALYGYADSLQDRLIGNSAATSQFSGLLHNDNGRPCESPLEVWTVYLGGFVKNGGTRYCTLVSEGIWSASLAWDFVPGTKLIGLYYSDNLGVPEPGTWAMMILGFGIVGLAARRKHNLTTVPR